MPTYKHGVYVREEATSLLTPVRGTSGLQVIFGTAPVAFAEDPSTCLEPKLCYTYEEAVKALGYSDDWDSYTLCQSMDACFRVHNVAPVVLVNVYDPTKSGNATAVAQAEMPVSNHKCVISAAATKSQAAKDNSGIAVQLAAPAVPVFGVLRSTVVVKASASGAALDLDYDYTLSQDSDGYTTITLLSGGTAYSATSLYVAYSVMKPSAVTKTDIIGGYDNSTGKRTGLELVHEIYPRFGLTPGLLLAPGWSDTAEVVAALEAHCEGISGVYQCEAIADVPTSGSNAAAVYTAVKTAKDALGMDNPHLIACWPKAAVGEKVYCLSALLGALCAQTDAENGDVPARSPSNLSLGATRMCLDDGSEIVLTQDQANLVNSYGVVTGLAHGSIRSWGNRTACYPETTDPKDMWINARRLFTWLSNTLILTYFQKVDDIMNFRLIESIVDSFNVAGNSYVANGYCAVCKARYDADDNPVTELLDGHITFRIDFAPYTPAEQIEFVLTYDTNAVATALAGGEG